jgi:hypothetical protein
VIIQKPEDEILSEYSSHWPTAIGKYVFLFFFQASYNHFDSNVLTVQGVWIPTMCSEP